MALRRFVLAPATRGHVPEVEKSQPTRCFGQYLSMLGIRIVDS